MKKGSGPSHAASNRDSGGGGYTGHRSTASSSVGVNIKARGNATASAVESAATPNTNERTGYHQAAGGTVAKVNPLKQQTQSSAGAASG